MKFISSFLDRGSLLVLKKKHHAVAAKSVKESPPEFPEWTSNMEQQSLDMSDKLANSALLKLYLNIKDDTRPTDDDSKPLADLETLQVDHNINIVTTLANVPTLTTLSGASKKDSIALHSDSNSSDLNVRNNVQNQPDPVSSEHVQSESKQDYSNHSQEDQQFNLLPSPLMLKTQCIQKMLGHAVIDRPPTLLMSCIDFLSWDDKMHYPCFMKLPRTMSTKTHVAELQSYSPPTDRLNISSSDTLWKHQS